VDGLARSPPAGTNSVWYGAISTVEWEVFRVSFADSSKFKELR
jgi:hypothetical protein